MTETELSELAHEIYLALQAITSCPQGCKCCEKHLGPALLALMDFVNRWRD